MQMLKDEKQEGNMNTKGGIKKVQLPPAVLLLKYWYLVLLILQIQLVGAAPLPQNPFEAVANGVLTMARSAADLLGNGAALRKDMGVSNDFFQVQHTAEAGFGKAILKPTDSDDYDSDEIRRRKRRSAPQMHATMAMVPTVGYAKQPQRREVHTHRGKRSPCYTFSQPSGGAEDAEDLRRRNARVRSAAQKKRATAASRKLSVSTKSPSSANKRYRRQAIEAEYLDIASNVVSSNLSQRVNEITKKMQGFFELFVNSMSTAAQKIKQTLSGGSQRPPTNEDI